MELLDHFEDAMMEKIKRYWFFRNGTALAVAYVPAINIRQETPHIKF